MLVLVGISQVTAFNMGSFYPASAPSSDIDVINTGNTPQIIPSKLGLGYAEINPPTYNGLNILGGFVTQGASVAGNVVTSGKLRVASLSTPADITAITTLNTAGEVPQAVSVSGGHIVYAAKKPATTRVACTDANGVIDTCTGSTVDNTPISGANYPTGSGAVIAVSPMSIQGNTAALWGQITAATSVADRTAKCYPNATWSGTTLVPGTATSC